MPRPKKSTPSSENNEAVIGHVLLDNFINEDDLIPILTDQDTAKDITSRRYVLIEETKERKKQYFAQIVRGPLHTPEWGNVSEGLNTFPIVKGKEIDFVPSFNSYYLAKVLGEIVETEDGGKKSKKIQTAFTRPLPKSRVSYIPKDELISFLALVSSTEKPVGILANYGTDDPVAFHLDDRLVNRQLGIFGSTGSGKSNTVIVVAETLLQRGWSVIIFDHSGEYYKMAEPSSEARLFLPFWRNLGIAPCGIEGEQFRRFLPVTDGRSDQKAIKFSVKSMDIPFLLIKAMMAPLSDAQNRVISRIHRDLGVKYDGLSSLIKEVQNIPESGNSGDLRYMSKPILLEKLETLKRMGIFDAAVISQNPGKPQLSNSSQTQTGKGGRVEYLSPEFLIRSSTLNVIDLGNTGDQDTINIIGLSILQMLETAKNKINSAYKDVKVAILLEEAHTFFSKEHAGRPEFAEALTSMIKRIFKVGRKFWLNPIVISQQPADIPPGIMSQCVMRISHQLSDERDIQIVGRGSAKRFSDILPDLRKGECLITTPEILAPQIVRIRPAMAKKVDPQTDSFE